MAWRLVRKNGTLASAGETQKMFDDYKEKQKHGVYVRVHEKKVSPKAK